MTIFRGPQEAERDLERALAAEQRARVAEGAKAPDAGKLPDDVKALFQELCSTYAEDLLDDPKGCVDSPEELKKEIALLIKAGPYVGVDFQKMFVGHGGKK